MVRVRGDVGRAAAAAAAAELGLPADLQYPAPPAALRQVAQLPAAVQKMWCHARDVDEFHEQAGAVIAAYKKSLAAGAMQSTAERAAAAVAYKIDPGYREYMEYDKQWNLQRGEAAAQLEALAMKARRLVKNAQRLVSRGTLPKRLQGACEDAYAPHRAMNIAEAIRDEVAAVRELVVQLDVEARAIPDHFELPCAKEEVQSCKRSMDRMQLKAERAYEVARDVCCPTKSGVRQAWSM